MIVVTQDRSAERLALAWDAEVLAEPEESSHSEAALIGVREAMSRGARSVLLVPGDCPHARPRRDRRARGPRADGPGVIVVPDRHGTGTNAPAPDPARRRSSRRSAPTAASATSRSRARPACGRGRRGPLARPRHRHGRRPGADEGGIRRPHRAAPRTRAACSPACRRDQRRGARGPARGRAGRRSRRDCCVPPRRTSGPATCSSSRTRSSPRPRGAIRALDAIEPSPRALALAAELALPDARQVASRPRRVRRNRPRATVACSSAGPATASSAPTPASMPQMRPTGSSSCCRPTLTRRRAACAPACPAVPRSSSPTRSGAPWRHGQVDVAIGIAGLHGARRLAWAPRPGRARAAATWIAIADQAAAAADLARAGKDAGRRRSSSAASSATSPSTTGRAPRRWCARGPRTCSPEVRRYSRTRTRRSPSRGIDAPVDRRSARRCAGRGR